jgi:hypothetical protein
MEYLKLFKMPNPVKITGRSSSITNSFVNSIIPVIPPTNEQVKRALEALGMTPDDFSCAYCGNTATEWDHLKPLVMNKMPTGYISEIHNLVPSCGKCNQSKGNKPWEAWMRSTAAQSPFSRKIADIEDRIERIKAYEAIQEPTRIDFSQVVDTDFWQQHWENCEKIHKMLQESQKLARQINETVANHHAGHTAVSTELVREGGKDPAMKRNPRRLASENIENLKKYRLFIEERKVGARDKVASSVDSYVLYLNSVANQLDIRIGPDQLSSGADIESLTNQLRGHKVNESSLANWRSAMKQYVSMVLSGKP